MNEKIKELIDKTGMSVATASKAIDIPEISMRKILKNEMQPSVEQLIKIADYFQMPIDILLDRCDKELYENILKDYKQYFMQIRRKYYQDYSIGRAKQKIIDDITNTTVYEAPYPYNLIQDITGEVCHNIIENDSILENALNYLNPQEKLVMEKYYKQGMSYTDIGKELNLTKERIRQVVNKALRVLKTPALKNSITNNIKEDN